MGIFKRSDLWDTLDDIGHFNGTIPWRSTWRKRSFGLIATGIFVIVGAMAVGRFQENTIMGNWSHAKENDPIYADTSRLRDTAYFGVTLFRRIRPLDHAELSKAINEMNIPEWDKSNRITQLDTNSKSHEPVMIYSEATIDRDSMFKYKTFCIGTLLLKDSLTAQMPTKDLATSAQKWFAIKPNKQLLSRSEMPKLPLNYVYADDYYYVDPLDITLGGEPAAFKKARLSSQ
ncbi:hypothetical protein [Mucilaginibacter sp. PAMB04168]|uniref:hypothetical protein n=1 Tax=Mucilaginibacter sp. PAMB04168 TaxID=3138567 RepID=UPI0031F71DE6